MNKKILVTGASGFVGRNLVGELRARGCRSILCPSSSELNLTIQDQVARYFDRHRPQIVLHLAGLVGGIGVNKSRPAEFFYENAMMSILLNHFCYKSGVEKLVSLAAGCGYPKNIPVPFTEDDFWNGFPDENSYGYSLAKKNLIVGAWAYKEQYNFPHTVLIPANLYGPHDNFNLETSHVVPALIRKFIEASKDNLSEVEVWGTGSATREFLYVDDTVKAIIDAIYCPDVGPFNLGTGVETPVVELVEIISRLTNFRGKIKWDKSRPDGQPRRFYDMSKFKESFGYVPQTTLTEGLSKTIGWYKKNAEKK